MPLTVPDDLGEVVAAEPVPLLFATVSGAHLYGFPSRDSDVDLRGVHLLPVADVVGLNRPQETITRMWDRADVELDLVTHDLLKFVRLLLRPNGYVLEQVLSPLVVHSTPEHAELVALTPGCLTARHAHHYRGFARTQWRLFEKTGELKPLLYTFRALLTGIHLLAEHEVEANPPALLARHPAPGYLPELVEAKRAGEHRPLATLPGAPSAETAHAAVEALHERLTEGQEATALPERPTAEPAMHDLLVRLRLSGLS